MEYYGKRPRTMACLNILPVFVPVTAGGPFPLGSLSARGWWAWAASNVMNVTWIYGIMLFSLYCSSSNIWHHVDSWRWWHVTRVASLWAASQCWPSSSTTSRTITRASLPTMWARWYSNAKYLSNTTWWRHQIGNIFRVTRLLCEESTGHWWIPLAKASDAELWWFL